MAAALTRLRTALARAGIIELATLVVLLLPMALLLRSWDALPDMVPVHFDSAGEPDRFGPKSTLIYIHLFSAGMWLLFTFLQSLPITSMNLPVKLTSENRTHVERITHRALALFKLVLVATLGAIGHQTLLAANADAASLPVWLILLATLGPLPVIIWLVVAAQKGPKAPARQGGGS